jgi:hypothetical protein
LVQLNGLEEKKLELHMLASEQIGQLLHAVPSARSHNA